MNNRAKAAMTLEQLIQFQRAVPFRPYRIHLADGKALDVMHPEFLARSPRGRTAVLYQPDERSDVIDLLLVTRFEQIDLKRRPATKRRTRR